jgi:lipoprotein signal peptidase
MSRTARTLTGALAALAVLAADQGSKYWVLHILHLPDIAPIALLPLLKLTFVRNVGITFGLLASGAAWSSVVLATVALAVVAFLAVWLYRCDRLLVALALGAVAGGAVGNIADRIQLGYVVDFILFDIGGWFPYVFNIGDSAIVCGVAVLVLDGMRHPSQPRTPGQRLAAAPGDK